MSTQFKKLLSALIGLTLCFAAYQAKSQTLNDARNLTAGEQFESAAKVFTTLIGKEPNNGTNYYYFGENFLKTYFADTLSNTIKEMTDAALVYYTKGLEVDPNNPLNNVGKGKVAYYTGDLNTAKTEFDLAQSKFPSKTNKASKLSKEDQAITLMCIAEAYIYSPKKKNISLALTFLDKAILLNPKNPEIYLVKGDAYMENNDGTNAILNYKKAEELDPKSPKAKLRIGQLRYRTKQYQDAQTYYKDALLIDSTYAPAYLELGVTFAKAGQNEVAKKYYKKYLELSNNVSAKVKYGLVLFELRDFTEAIKQFDEVLALDPNRNDLNRALAFCYYEDKKYDKALSYMNKFFSNVKPEKTINMDYVYYARILSKSKMDSLAVIQYKIAFQRDSTNLDMLSEMATSYARMKKYNEAIEALTLKTNIMKDKADALDYYAIGRNYYNIGNWEKADTAFGSALALQPGLINALHLKAVTKDVLDPDVDENKKPKLKEGKAKPYFELLIQKTDQDSVKFVKQRIDAYNYLAYYYLLYKEYCNSYIYWQKLLAIDPNNKNAIEALKDPKVKCK
jgi:tetratricopeptide (TPR) repeat protein